MQTFCLLRLLLLAAVAGCNQRAPTAAERGNLVPDHPAVTSFGGISALAIQLPVNQSIATTAPNPAFRVNQTGTGPNGIFQITSSTSTETALQGLTNGRGRAGFFQINNDASTQAALRAETNGPGPAVYGYIASSNGRAGYFQINNNVSRQAALEGQSNGLGPAVYGRAQASGPAGDFVVGNTQGGTAVTITTIGKGPALIADQVGTGTGGIIRVNNSSNTSTALEVTTVGNGLALRVTGPSSFQGDVMVNGTLTKSAGSFRIDHPLDPEHKYLSHSFVESPDMMNVYNGNVTLDASGRGTVELPDYFEALNGDFRYQLTAIGAPGPNLYIAHGIMQNRFQIAGGRAYAHVSWQVTGVRRDAYAEQHRIKVEEEKPSR